MSTPVIILAIKPAADPAYVEVTFSGHDHEPIVATVLKNVAESPIFLGVLAGIRDGRASTLIQLGE